MLFAIAIGLALGLSGLLRARTVEDLLDAPHDPLGWVRFAAVAAFGLPGLFGARDAGDWFGVWAGKMPATGPDLYTLTYFVLPAIFGAILGETLRGRIRPTDLFGYLLTVGLSRQDSAFVEAASFLFGDRVSDARLQAAVVDALPGADTRRVRRYAAALAGEILSVDDLPLDAMARQMSCVEREAWIAALCRIGASLRAVGVEQLAWIRVLGTGLGLAPPVVRLILQKHGFKSDADWRGAWTQSRDSHRRNSGFGDRTSGQSHTAPQTSPDCPWSVLGLAPGAASGQIKSAYRNLAKRYHPDRFATAEPAARAKAEARMKTINAAYARVRA